MTRAHTTLLFAALLALGLTGCSDSAAEDDHGHAHGEEVHAEEKDDHGHGHGDDHAEGETGPNGGRLLEEGDIAVEIVVFEAGDAPRFRLYASDHGAPVPSDQVAATIDVTRIGGDVQRFTMRPSGAFLVSDAEVGEPHSFDVTVNATIEGKAYSWTYESYESRTEISAEAAADAGVVTAIAGPAMIRETVELSGRTVLAPAARAEIRAWYPGRITAVHVNIGDRVAKGARIATVEARDSLKAYEIAAPIAGVVLERSLNIGDLADQIPIAVIGDPTALQAELHVFPRDAERVRAGQEVVLHNLAGTLSVTSKIDVFLPAAEIATQTVTARASLPNPDEAWRAGMAIEGDVTIAAAEAPVAVKATALQRMNGGAVVFIQAGDTYQAQPVTTGRRDGEWVEITEGLKPGQIYVAENSFLIRADIEKSGAAHEH